MKAGQIIRIAVPIWVSVMLNITGLRAGEIHDAVAAGDLNKVRALVEANPALLESKDDGGNTPLHSACITPPPSYTTRQVAVANFLIDKGANVNVRNNSGVTPLLFATRNLGPDFGLVQRLVAKGADVNSQPDPGMTSLHWVVISGDIKAARFLIDHGANLDAYNNIYGTVLHTAINSGRDEEMAKLLVERGAQPNRKFSFGNTELHLAAMKGYAGLVRILVEHGADVHATNENNRTALYYAAKLGYRRTVDALLAGGAKETEIVESNYGRAPQLVATLQEGEAYLWNLRGHSGSGYAVKTKGHLLLFDPSEMDAAPEAGLANGYLNPNELAGQNVTVLMTGSGLGSESNVLELTKRIPGTDLVTCFKPASGSEGSDTPRHHLAAPHESFRIGDLQVHAIPATGRNAEDVDAGGVGYLVEADGVKIFHAGFHSSRNRAEQLERYRKEIDFLKPFGPIDIAILPVSGHVSVTYQPYLYLLDQLSPKAVYLMGGNVATSEYPKCLEVLRARNVPLAYPEGGIAVGERFHFLREQTLATPLPDADTDPRQAPMIRSAHLDERARFQTKLTRHSPAMAAPVGGAQSIRTAGTVTDIDGNVYKTVTIGRQVWMAENLKTTRYRNGDIIGTTTPATLDISGENTPKYQWAYAGDERNVATYGRLYTWYAATDSRNLAPVGWHVATEDEWKTLIDFLGGEKAAQGKLKEAGTAHWGSPNSDATNESGFTALPGGNRFNKEPFVGLGEFTHWWTATEHDARFAWRRTLWKNAPIENTGGWADKQIGWFVRCIQDVSTPPSVAATRPPLDVTHIASLPGPYFGLTPPGMNPEVFACGIISTAHHEHSAPAFSPHGNEVFWSLWRRPDQGDPQVIMTTRRENGTWSKPAAASFSGKYLDGGPVFSADGKRLYFYSTRPTPAGPTLDDIWFVERQDAGWSEPRCLGLVGKLPEIQSAYQPSVTRTGTLYFTAHPPIDRDEFFICRVELIDGEYSKPELLPPGINVRGGFVNWTPFIAPDESYLLFSSNRRDPDHDGGDLYVSRHLADGSWTEPVSLGDSVNTPGQERFPMVSPDSKFLFFTRPTPGRAHDVYWVSTAAIPALHATTGTSTGETE